MLRDVKCPSCEQPMGYTQELIHHDLNIGEPLECGNCGEAFEVVEVDAEDCPTKLRNIEIEDDDEIEEEED